MWQEGAATAVYYSYDLRNLQTGARFASTSGEGITNIFDGFGRLTSTSSNLGGNTRRLDYQYDPNGNRTRITHPDGNYFTTSWDGLNRPVALQANGATTIASTEYYAHGAPWVINRIGQATEINYDNVQRPYVLHHYLPTAGDVYWVSTFNPAGQINATVRTNDAYAWTRHYAANRGYTTNGLNQYSQSGDTAILYDANGNLTSTTSPTSGSSAYVYDIENRMVGAPSSTVLSYDPLGRLFQVSNASATTQFLYDGDAMVAEYDGSNVLTHRHVHNVGADVPMATYAVTGGTGLGTISQLFADRQGSIVAQLTSGGVGVTPNTYDEYGIPGTGNSGRFQYTGQIWLNEIGMYYYKARIYSPTLGRFMQTDPIGYEGGNNLYAYVGDDPINRVDPSGECCYESTDPRHDQIRRMTEGTLQFNQEHPTAAKVLAIGAAAILAVPAIAFVLPEVGVGGAIAGGVEAEADASAAAAVAAEAPAAVESPVAGAIRSLEAPPAPRPTPRITAEVPGPGGPRTVRIPAEPQRTTPYTESRGRLPMEPARSPAGTNPSGGFHVAVEAARVILRILFPFM